MVIAIHTKKIWASQVWWHMSVITALKRQRLVDPRDSRLPLAGH